MDRQVPRFWVRRKWKKKRKKKERENAMACASRNVYVYNMVGKYPDGQIRVVMPFLSFEKGGLAAPSKLFNTPIR